MGRSTKEKDTRPKKKSQRSPIKSHSLKNSAKSFSSSLRRKRKVSKDGFGADENGHNRSFHHGLKKTHASFENFNPRPFPRSLTGSPTQSPTTSSIVHLRDMDSSLFADAETMKAKANAPARALTSPILSPGFFSPPTNIRFGPTTEILPPDTSTLCLDQSTGGKEKEGNKKGKETSPFKRLSPKRGRPIRPASSIFPHDSPSSSSNRVMSFKRSRTEAVKERDNEASQEDHDESCGSTPPPIREMRTPFSPEPATITRPDPFKLNTPLNKRRRLTPASGNRRNSVVEEKIDYFEEKIRLSGIQDSPLVTKDALSRFLRRGGTVPSGLSMFEVSTLEEDDDEEEEDESETQKKIEEAEQRCTHLKLEITRLETTLQDQKGKEITLRDELATQTILIEENTSKLEVLKKEAHERLKKLGNGEAERIRLLEEEITKIKDNIRKLKEEDQRLRALWDEKCLEDCDRTMGLFEKEERWEEEAQEMNDQIAELEKELNEQTELKQQVEDLEQVMKEANERKEHAEREIKEYEQKIKVLEKTLSDLQTNLAETLEELDSFKQSLPTDPLTNDDFEEIQMKVKQQKDARMGMEEELALLQDQVDELEDSLATSREMYKEKIQGLDKELTTYQSRMESEIVRRVENQVQEELLRRKKQFHEGHKELAGELKPSKREIEEKKKKVGEYLEEKIRRELREKIQEEVQEELESEIICHFQEVEREGMSEIDSLLDDDMDGPYEGRSGGVGRGGGGGFVDRLQEILMQQCRESIFEEAEEIWAEEKAKMESELEELRSKAETAEARERELTKKAGDYTRKVQAKIREINRMKYGSTANLLATSQVTRQSSGVTPSTPQHIPVHTRTSTAPTEYSHQGKPATKESEKDVEERAMKAAQAAQMRVREEKRREREKREREKREKREKEEREEAFGSPARPVTPACSRVKKTSRLSGTPIRRTRDQTNGTPKFVKREKKEKQKKKEKKSIL